MKLVPVRIFSCKQPLSLAGEMYLENLESQVNQENIFIIQVFLLELHFFNCYFILKVKGFLQNYIQVSCIQTKTFERKWHPESTISASKNTGA